MKQEDPSENISKRTLFLGLFEERRIQRSKIDARVDLMIEKGFVEEVETLRKMGYGPGLKSMNSIGYKELNRYVDGFVDLDDAISTIKTETKRYAKRQVTWFKRNRDLIKFVPGDWDKIRQQVSTWLSG